MVEKIHIEKAGLSDAKLVSDLSNITFKETFRGTCPDSDLDAFVETCFNEQQTLNEIIKSDDQYYIAFADGHPVGYIRIVEDYTDYPDIRRYKAVELKRIYVLKEFHSQKVGAALMTFALKWASEKKYEAVWLGVWENNKRGIAFYEQFGLADTGERHTFFIGETAQTDHWMIKML